MADENDDKPEANKSGGTPFWVFALGGATGIVVGGFLLDRLRKREQEQQRWLESLRAEE